MVASQSRRFQSGVSIFKLNDGSQLRDISPYIQSFDGLPGEKPTSNSTTWGSSGKRPGLHPQENKITMKLLFNMVTDVGVNTVLEALWDNETLAAFEFYPAGTAAGNLKITGSAYLTLYKIASSMGDDVLVNAELEVDNGVTTTTA